MLVFIGCDHAAFTEKELLKEFLAGLGHEVNDCGTHSSERCNYPDYAVKVAKEVARCSSFEDGCGVLICGSGVGVSMVANRYSKVRAALCRTVNDAELSRQHNNANVLCLGARTTSFEDLKNIVSTWLEANFEEGRHSERVALFNELGEKA